METPFVLQASLEKNYRRDARYDLALRAILLRATAHSRQRGLGKWIHDTRRLNRSDPGYYQGVTASRRSRPYFNNCQAVAPWVGLVCHALRCIVIGCDFRGSFENCFRSTQAKACGSTFAAPLTQ